jgi:hypothetical protein
MKNGHKRYQKLIRLNARFGSKAVLRSVGGKSAHPSTPDIRRLRRHVCFVPTAEAALSFDHFVSAGKEKGRDAEPEYSRGLKVEPQIKGYWLLDRNIARFFSFYYLVHHLC